MKILSDTAVDKDGLDALEASLKEELNQSHATLLDEFSSIYVWMIVAFVINIAISAAFRFL